MQTDEIQSADDAFTGGSSGIFGDTKNLVLHISRPSRALVYASSAEEEAEAAGRSDLASVSYFMADANAGGLAGSVAQQTWRSIHGGGRRRAGTIGRRSAVDRAGRRDGRRRLTGRRRPRCSLRRSCRSSSPIGTASNGSTRGTRSAAGRLPSAIGITLSLDVGIQGRGSLHAGPYAADDDDGKGENIGEPVQIRYVVAVPLAEPYVSEASF